jgi:hypothetical protein
LGSRTIDIAMMKSAETMMGATMLATVSGGRGTTVILMFSHH